MKIIGFMGSPRFGGNTELLLDAMLDGASSTGAETRKYRLYSMKFSPCIECGGCDETGVCILKDDFTPVYDELESADWIVVASPIFFYNISSMTQAVVERSQACWVRKYVLKKPAAGGVPKGLFLSVGATKGKLLFDGVKRVMKYFFDAVGAEFSGSILYRGVEKKGEIASHPTALSEVRRAGELMARGEPLDTIEGLEK